MARQRNQEPVSVIVNVFDEAATIEAEIRAIHAGIVARLPGSEFIVAEDGSTDGTKEIIARLVGELGVIHLTSAARKGYARALGDALAAARNPWIFFADAGGKNDFADFWKLYELRHGAGLVLGYRSGRTDRLYRRFLSAAYNRFLRLYFGVPVRDADCGFRLYNAALAREVAAQTWINRDLIASELVIRLHAMGAVIREVPVAYRQRHGVSRGLPPKRIPKVVFGVLGNMKALKRECAGLARRHPV